MNKLALRFDILAMRQHLFHLYQEIFNPVIEKHSLTQMEADIILFLANNPQYDTASEIVAIRRLTKSHVSSSIEKLAQKGLLERNHDEANKKLIHLKLLPAAQPVVEEGRQCQKTFMNILSDGIPEQDLQTASRVLTKMISNIKKYEGEPQQ